jgi:gamma-glutamylcyclotransferase (GGCT)/AIG2-like uncharacterized protein YtfP
MERRNEIRMSTDLLFVYGTLRRDGSNDIARIAPAARFAGAARVRGRLYDLGAYPALLLDADAGWVSGEVYCVCASDWPALDALEEPVTPNRPTGEYFKVCGEVEGDDGVLRRAWIYVANPAMLRLDREVAGGDWIAHAAVRAAASRAGAVSDDQ